MMNLGNNVTKGFVLVVNNLLKDKYSRQILFAPIGEEGQEKLLASRVVIVGCGAIGAASASLLARAGVGLIRIIDRDFVEPSNLQRQALFDESDAFGVLPKAIAAERKLRSINSSINLEGVVADVAPHNVCKLLNGFDLILDGTDNFETRFLINDFAVRQRRPWIYAAAVGSYGVAMPISPGETACLACLLDSRPQGLEETCDTVGVISPIVNLIASLECAEALRLLTGHKSPVAKLVSCDIWSGRFQGVGISRNPDCQVCVHRRFAHLEGQAQPHITMCGRNSVQIHQRSRALDLATLRNRLAPTVGEVRHNDYLLRFQVPPYEMTVFADGRAILKGTQDPAVARTLYARYIGS